MTHGSILISSNQMTAVMSLSAQIADSISAGLMVSAILILSAMLTGSYLAVCYSVRCLVRKWQNTPSFWAALMT
ncbi:hypothetical protein B0189_03300 [Moraxella cuniculi]|nr:hypothetical protein B0189_03300 [Moraxella cuniculi]